jgi:hypothetical protein
VSRLSFSVASVNSTRTRLCMVAVDLLTLLWGEDRSSNIGLKPTICKVPARNGVKSMLGIEKPGSVQRPLILGDKWDL